MSDFETRLRRTVQTVAEDAPAGDELWTTIEARIETERRRRAITRFAGGALAVAAIIVAAVVTVAALQQAPVRQKVEVQHPKPNGKVGPPKSAPVAGVPGGGVVVGRSDGRVTLVDRNWHDVRTLVPSTPGTVVSALAVLPDGDHVVVLRRPSIDIAAAASCGTVSEIDLRTGASTGFGDAVSFALSPDGAHVAIVRSNDRAGNCTGGSPSNGSVAPQSNVVVRDLSDDGSQSFALGTGLVGGTAFSPDGHELAVSFCVQDSCEIRIFGVGPSGALTSRTRLPIVVNPASEAAVYAPRITWTAQGIPFVAMPEPGSDMAQARILDPSSGSDSYFTHSVGGRDIMSLGDRLYLIDHSGTGLLRVEDSTFGATSISPDVTAMTNRHNAA